MRLALLATTCLLTACQSMFHQDYAGDNAAILTFSSDDLPAQPVICVPGEGFRETSFSVGRDGYKILNDLNEAMKKSPEVVVKVQASGETLAGFRYRDSARTAEKSRCRIAMRFSSEPGEHYQLRLDDDRCAVSVTRLSGTEWLPHAATPGAWHCE